MARVKYSNEEVELLARLIQSEALGEGEQGMLLVGNVVINRVVANCDVFRNTRSITEVIYQKMLFLE
ncbi:cell wall hydrolase [Coprobacillaceae bacterium CR2/5/TPMF4]|nr:cell wall hydrolase [Coprobacillaceae bacterium CR2/5/TPMF4]